MSKEKIPRVAQLVLGKKITQILLLYFVFFNLSIMFSKTHFFVVLAMCCLVTLSTSAQSLPVQGKYQVTKGNYPFGDLNHHGEVNVADINLLIGVVLGEYVPVDDDTPNMTIAEFKAKHWQDARNYVDTITITTFDDERARVEDDYFLFAPDYESAPTFFDAVKNLQTRFPGELIVVTGCMEFVYACLKEWREA